MRNLVLFITLTACPSFLFAQKTIISQEEKLQLLENLTHVIHAYYVYPDKAEEITDYLKKLYATAKYDSLNNPTELENELTKNIFFISKDKHIRIAYNPGLENDILKFNASGKNAEKISLADLNKERQKNFYFRKVQILPSNIGYIEFTNFAKPGKEANKTLAAVMQFISNTDALIIDLRNNYGGNGTMVNEILNYFFENRTYSGRAFNRIENKWTDSYVGSAKKKSEKLFFNKPIYILTSSATFSAAEGFAYALQYLKKAMVIGETTRGGAHLTRSFSLGNGFVGFIPYARFENAITKTDWEGKGVIPDIPATSENSLLMAQQDILKKKLLSADENEKKKISWLLNYYKSKTTVITVSSSIAKKYEGRYAEFEVKFENNELKIRDTNQPTIQYKSLKPITETLFQAGEDYQIEFLSDSNGIINAIKMYWEDGWSEEIERLENDRIK
ncbi:S41 family peptidase [Flavobacterium microcysteis]|nr:S41 family peptidase [Flavobacterium microcysteis]